ncbi:MULTISPECIES: LysR family transcriptional regulator [Gordonia]|uniref:Putative LysR family transcriptional regulator n=1 Tax=Gordonia sihwensis NBRC 108236 TaxID=1223544 RepID=L7LPW0_9ACTN|nr:MULTISPECIES: LysR family transcriptional regulator [Gordonia]AUH67273.1 LysR family transcriptional regulator [Gordonia sp. YC-JH1]KJR08539.1 LysR family transcriptional regulator [Gordonia sihwensis]KXT58336.1 LysR family transcriptional regulator [Gordonia sp. QH-12]GAC62078.1 putative LysR family transcriptional regulator [Gordonia sihwensis NBRC 108236]
MDLRSIDLGALELLVGVDDHGSLSAAARALHVAQPNASRAIGRLERLLGVRLLDRVTTGSRLTPDGTVLVHWARRTVDDARALLDVAAGLLSDTAAEVTVDASMTVAEHLMPLWLGTFRTDHPETTVHLRVRNSSAVFEAVASGACDVGFVESPSIPSGLHSAVVARDRLVLVVPPGHKWSRRRRPIDIAELAATPLLVREPGSGTRTTLEVALTGYDIAPPILELGSSAAIRTAVAGGVGPAVLSTLAVQESARSGELRVIDVDGLDLTRELRAVWRPPRTLQGPAAELVRIARRSAQ